MTDQATSPAREETLPPSRTVLGYQPSLDGIRAFAIVSVMLFHTVYRRTLFQAGYLGVDAFFVLSGFLITTLLLQEHGRWQHIGLRNFYVRRALRLLPLVVLLVLTGVVVNRLTTPTFAGRPNWLGLLGTSFYVANWMHLWHPQSLGFLGHTWSLAIEEQFYLVWPPLVVFMLWCGARRWVLLATTTGLTLASAGYRAYEWYQVHHYPAVYNTFFPALMAVNQRTFQVSERVYYSSFAHADGLLLGCALAVLLTSFPLVERVSKRVASVLALAGVVVAALVMRAANGSGHPYFLPGWGLLVFELTIAVVTGALVLQPRIWLAKPLSSRVAVWVGRRSYGLYVIHGVIFSLLSHPIPNARYLIPSMWLLTFVLAALSFRYVESPILALKGRLQRPRPRAVGSAQAGATDGDRGSAEPARPPEHGRVHDRRLKSRRGRPAVQPAHDATAGVHAHRDGDDPGEAGDADAF